MITRDMTSWETAICHNISRDGEDEVIVRGQKLSALIGQISFASMMYLVLRGHLPTPSQARVLDALLVASVEHSINPMTIVSRSFASYGTSIQSAVGAGITALGDRMGGLGEQLARLLAEQIASLGDVATITDEQLTVVAREVVADATRRGMRVPGYGIPLHGADPRSPAVLAVAREEGQFGVHCRLAVLIEQELAKARGGRPVPMNLDGVGAAIILDLGFDWRTTRMFLITPRSVSLGAHYLEEQSQDSVWRHARAEQVTYTGPSPG